MLARVETRNVQRFRSLHEFLWGENLGFVRSRGELSGLPRGTTGESFQLGRVHHVLNAIDLIWRYSREIRETAGPRKSVCSPDRGNKIKYTSRVGLSSGEVRLFDFDLCRPQYAMQCEVLERKGEKGPTLPARCRLRFQYFFSFFFLFESSRRALFKNIVG